MAAVPQWPPDLTEKQLLALTELATTFALSHGLLYLPLGTTAHSTAPTSAIHAPLALFPSPIPRRLFELAHRLQHIYNVLYARIAMDTEFLDQVMGEEQGVGKVDDFTGQLWRGWKQGRVEKSTAETLHLGIFRSDYLLHSSSGRELELKQVEFNTVASSFGPLSQQVSALHRYLLAATGYFQCSPHLVPEQLPANESTSGLAAGLAEAHKAYGHPRAQVLFVVQPGERNVFDQRWLEYELLERHSIHVIRQTFEQLATSARLDPATKALFIEVSEELSPDPIEVSVIYFRAGYAPTDYTTEGHYRIRNLLDRSRAINCPSIPLQLAGGKKVQQVLTNPGVLEHFLSASDVWGPEHFSSEDLDLMRASWMTMWGLDDDDAEDQPLERSEPKEPFGVRRVREHFRSLVLKPQREGGGNNIYKTSIPPFLDALDPQERAAWIAMELISPPEGVGNYLVRAGSGKEGAVKTDVVSELGIFGWALFGKPSAAIVEREAGWLLRTKGKDSDEGGVAAGFSVLDSVVLVD